jgi:hypothetical protein
MGDLGCENRVWINALNFRLRTDHAFTVKLGPKAVEYYHSATPELGHDYGQKVYAVLPEETKLAYAAEPLPLAGGWAMTPNRSLLISPMRQIGRVIPRATGLGGEPTPGRTLDSYRSAPVRMAFRAP